MPSGSVSLIGAGPGDPGLITVRGLRLLETADVVVYDHRVHARLLRSARADAERIDVGPAAPQPLEQEAISLLLADWALPLLGVESFRKEIAHAVGIAVPVVTSYFGHRYWTFGKRGMSI